MAATVKILLAARDISDVKTLGELDPRLDPVSVARKDVINIAGVTYEVLRLNWNLQPDIGNSVGVDRLVLSSIVVTGYKPA